MTSKHELTRPNFLVIGAPRSGTTSLHDMLAQHPDIFMSAIKEPHFFSSLDFPFPDNDILQITKDPEAYEALFAQAGDKISGESSTYYLFDPEAPARIKAYNPAMKLIAILREPVQRAHSHYLLYDRRGKQPPFHSTVERLMAGDVGSPVYDIVRLGLYGEQLQNYYRHFPSEQLLVVNFRDFTQRPVETLEQILTHIGADASYAAQLAEAKPQNQYQVPRSQTLAKLTNNPTVLKTTMKLVPRPVLRAARNNLLLKKGAGGKEPVDAAMAAKLRAFYAADEKILADLLGTTPAKLWPKD